jgi:RNA polymerase sigma-70 factor (ECF subfamily)
VQANFTATARGWSTAMAGQMHVAAAGVASNTDADSGEEFMRGLYERFKPQMEAYVMRLTRDAQRAEDIVQAALIRAWQARRDLTEGEAATRSWLYTVAYRIFIDEYRSRSLRPVWLTGTDIAQPGSADSEVERLVSAMMLKQAMSALSHDHRQAIIYVYYMNLTVDEAAGRLGIAPGTVKSRLHYALRALRKQLAPALYCQQLVKLRCHPLRTGRHHATARRHGRPGRRWLGRRLHARLRLPAAGHGAL